jgi:hypothetical protein
MQTSGLLKSCTDFYISTGTCRDDSPCRYAVRNAFWELPGTRKDAFEKRFVGRERQKCGLERCCSYPEDMVEVDENRSLPHVVAFSVLIASSLRAMPVSATLRRCAACFNMNQFPAPGNL